MRAYGSLFQPITIIIVAVLFTFAPASVKAANLTVCASGCQYTTIQSAMNAAATGDTIRVSPGTYSGTTINKQIILESEDYNRLDPKLNPITINSSLTIQGSWAWDQGPTIRGFALRSTDAIIGNAPFTAEYNYVSGGSDGISFEPGSGGILRGNYVENTGDDCIDVDHQTKNILIENNKLINCGQDGIEIRQQDDSISSRISLMFRNNYVDGSGEDGIQIMDYNNFSNRSYMVERNVFIRNGKAGIGLMAGDVTNQNYSAPAMPEPLYAVNNTFVDNDAGISGGANLIAINNIFQGQKTFDLKNVNGNSKIFNSLFAVSAKQQGTNNLDTATTKTGSPLLDGNYQLQSGSPAIDAGRANYQHTYTGPSGSVTDTVLNLTTSNYSGSAPDLGWIESTGTAPPTTTITTSPTVCVNKSKGDADCIPDGVGKQITIVDFQIWRNEFFAGCSSTNLTAASCQTDEDHDGSLMDANFDADTSVSIADFEIWRKGYFGGIGNPTATPTSGGPIPTSTPTPTGGTAVDSSFACLALPGPLQTVTGFYNQGKFEPAVESNKKFDARTASFEYPRTISHFMVSLRNDGANISNMCWAGGYFTSSLSWHGLNVSWEVSKQGNDDVGAERGEMNNTSSASSYHDKTVWTGLHVYNMHDAIRTNNTYNNWTIQHSWFDYIRDDCIENDSNYSGTVFDSLFDGCYTGVSNQSGNGAGQQIKLDKVLIRMEPMPYPYKWDTKNQPLLYVNGYPNVPFSHGSVFKGDEINWPQFAVTNTVILQEFDPEETIFPTPDKVSLCQNNTIIWLADPATAPRHLLTDFPGCFTIITDKTQGLAMWKNLVTDWHKRHPEVGKNRKPANPGVYKWPRY